MNVEPLSEMFDADRHWLEHQPEMSHWETACTTLRRQLDRWLIDYSTPMCEKAVTAQHADHPTYAGRMWDCWRHHWSEAAGRAADGVVDGWEVARRIRAGVGYRRGGRLGGDPLRDVVLAQAVVFQENRATTRFQADYFHYVKSLAGKFHRRYAADPDEWWNDFLDFLAGYTRPPGKLQWFTGRCGLQNWLGTVLWNFLRRRWRPAGNDTDRRPRIDEGPRSADRDPALQECVDLFGQLVAKAVADLPDEDRLVLCLLHVEGLKLKEVAAILGVHSGNAGRRRDRATRRLYELIARRADAADRSDSYRECLDSLRQTPQEFAQALYAALEKSHQQEARS